MARTQENPESLKEVNAIKVDDDVKTFVQELSKDVESARGDRKTWENRVEELRDLRYGYREKKTHPWLHCANYSIPLIDTHIQNFKAQYVSLANVTPVVSFVPYGGEDIEPARKREMLFDWRMRTKVDFFRDYCIGIDKMLEQGTVIFKVVWEYTTRTYEEQIDIDEFDQETLAAIYDERLTDEMLMKILVEEYGIDPEFDENIEALEKVVGEFRQGETQFTLDLVEVDKNCPKVIACDLKEDVMIPRDTTDIQFARFIDHKIWRTTNDIKIDMETGKYTKYDDDDIEAWAKHTGESVSRESTGINFQDEVILLHETCCWKDLDGSGIKRKCIVTYPDSNPDQVLRFIEVPYDHGMFPYVEVRRELNDVLMYKSRGIPELDQDYQIGITSAVNQIEDHGTIMNNPVVLARQNSVRNTKNRRYVPGEVVELSPSASMDDYQVRQYGNVAQPGMFNFAQYLKAWADQRVGNFAMGVSDETNLPGGGQGGKKTAREVDLIGALQQNISNLDVLVFQSQMKGVYVQIDALYDQYGDDVEEVLITGQQPIKVNRREIQCHYDMTPNGRVDNSNAQKRVAISTYLYDKYIENPFIDKYALTQLAIGDVHPSYASKIVKKPEQIQAEQQQQMQMSEMLRKRGIEEGLELRQIDMMLDVQKEAMLVPIQGRKYAPDSVKDMPKESAKERKGER